MPTSPAYTTISQILTLTPQTLENGWYAVGAPRVRMWFHRSADFLLFAGEVEGIPEYNQEHGPGEFVEGLWLDNCLELFVAEEGSSRYQEFNLSPTGAWWTCSFADVRSREVSQRTPEGVLTLSERGTGNWRAALRIPTSELAVRLGAEASRLNLTAIVGPRANQSFRSYAKIQTSKPDFHQPRYFVDVPFEPAPRST